MQDQRKRDDEFEMRVYNKEFILRYKGGKRPKEQAIYQLINPENRRDVFETTLEDVQAAVEARGSVYGIPAQIFMDSVIHGLPDK